MEVIPSNLAAEIQRHEDFLALVYADIIKVGWQVIGLHQDYVDELKATLFEMTGNGLEDMEEMSDKQILSELGVGEE